jgi:hypothetical protein
LFLPLPTKFGDIEKVTPGQAVSYSFYVVAAVALLVAVFVFIGLRNLRGEEGKGWSVLLGLGSKPDEDGFDAPNSRELRKEVGWQMPCGICF